MFNESKIAILKVLLKTVITDIFTQCNEFNGSYNGPSNIYATNKNDSSFDFYKHLSWYFEVNNTVNEYKMHVSRVCAQYHNLDQFYDDCFYEDGSHRVAGVELKKFNDEVGVLISAVKAAIDLEPKLHAFGAVDKAFIVTNSTGYKRMNEILKLINEKLILILLRVEMMVDVANTAKHLLPPGTLIVSDTTVIAGLRHGLADKEGVVGTDTLGFIIQAEGKLYEVEEVSIYSVPEQPKPKP